MKNTVIDLRSDTVTRPTVAMREAMGRAELGDDVFGEDPTVNALEEHVAGLLGKEAALFTPSGTMANQIALQVHTRPGDSVLLEESAHIFINEAGAGAALAGVQFDMMPLAEQWSDEAIRRCIRSDGLHAAPTTLLAIENTHNRALGRALPVSDVERDRQRQSRRRTRRSLRRSQTVERRGRPRRIRGGPCSSVRHHRGLFLEGARSARRLRARGLA